MPFLFNKGLSNYQHLLHHALDEGVSKSEGGGGKAVEDGWVDPVAVLAAVSMTERKDVQLVHVVRSQHYGKPLIVCDVLERTILSRPEIKVAYFIEMFLVHC